MDKEVGVGSWAVEDAKLGAFSGEMRSKAVARPVVEVEEGTHLPVAVVCQVPEWDHGQSCLSLLPLADGDLVLPRHDARHCPEEVVVTEAGGVQRKGGVRETLQGGREGGREGRKGKQCYFNTCMLVSQYVASGGKHIPLSCGADEHIAL